LKKIIDTRAAEKSQYFKQTLDLIIELTDKISNASLQQVLEEIKDRVETLFTFVIVGEVKAGKRA
jgi:hypothetical protein